MFSVTNIGDNKETVQVREWYEVDGIGLENVRRVEQGNKAYMDCIATFDIETTSFTKEECGVLGHDFGFMYVWQFCIDGHVFAGREWQDFIGLLNGILKRFRYEGTLVVYVHFLSFEFQFMRNFMKIINVFAREPRKPIRVTAQLEQGKVEFRCSYFLSNMSLAKWLTTGNNVTAKKMSGKDFNYSIKRYPDTELSNEEWGYCVCDVLGLYQRLKEVLKDDDLISIPMTSTGYVRREYRNAMQKNPANREHMLNIRLNPDEYSACYEATRGGLSGSNHVNTGYTLENVDSFDKKSSYPYQMICKYFPDSKFILCTDTDDLNVVERLLREYCCLILWSAKNLRLKRYESIPYITKDKCRAIYGGHYGNGKVYGAKMIGMMCTEIDLRIIWNHYTFEEFKVHKMYVARRGMLEKEFRQHLAEMFQVKTDMEDGDKFLYGKYKNLINGSFGMILTNILSDEIVYEGGYNPWQTRVIGTDEYQGLLDSYYRNTNNFLSYQRGVWVTAHARDDLVEGMDKVGRDIVQVDTDSVKSLGNHKKAFEEINKRIISEAEKFDVKPYSIKNGKKVYLGVWEHEHEKGFENEDYTYYKFRTWGAKKYASETKDGKMHITVAGLAKESGSEYFEKRGGIEEFRCGVKVPEGYCGRTESKYYDTDRILTIYVNGHRVIMGSCIGVFNSTYTLGITDEWNEVINGTACEYGLFDVSNE